MTPARRSTAPVSFEPLWEMLADKAMAKRQAAPVADLRATHPTWARIRAELAPRWYSVYELRTRLAISRKTVQYHVRGRANELHRRKRLGKTDTRGMWCYEYKLK